MKIAKIQGVVRYKEKQSPYCNPCGRNAWPKNHNFKTLGKINSHYALTEYGVAAQPFYVLLSPSGEVLSTRSYDLDVEAFKTWLSSVK